MRFIHFYSCQKLQNACQILPNKQVLQHNQECFVAKRLHCMPHSHSSLTLHYSKLCNLQQQAERCRVKFGPELNIHEENKDDKVIWGEEFLWGAAKNYKPCMNFTCDEGMPFQRLWHLDRNTSMVKTKGHYLLLAERLPNLKGTEYTHNAYKWLPYKHNGWIFL